MSEFKNKLYCFKNKITSEYIGEDYNPTHRLEEAIGWKTLELAKKDLKSLDKPDDFKIFKKNN